jgi:hypothetical protein
VERLTITLRIDPRARGSLADAVGPVGAATAEHLVTPDPEGWQHVRLSMEWPSEAHLRVLRLGDAVEVLEPADLRERVIREARAVLDRYVADGPDRCLGGGMALPAGPRGAGPQPDGSAV